MKVLKAGLTKGLVLGGVVVLLAGAGVALANLYSPFRLSHRASLQIR